MQTDIAILIQKHINAGLVPTMTTVAFSLKTQNRIKDGYFKQQIMTRIVSAIKALAPERQQYMIKRLQCIIKRNTPLTADDAQKILVALA